VTILRMVYVRNPEYERDVNTYISKVRFFLHPSFAPNDIVEVCKLQNWCESGDSILCCTFFLDFGLLLRSLIFTPVPAQA
jgi:hypothetical protein